MAAHLRETYPQDQRRQGLSRAAGALIVNAADLSEESLPWIPIYTANLENFLSFWRDSDQKKLDQMSCYLSSYAKEPDFDALQSYGVEALPLEAPGDVPLTSLYMHYLNRDQNRLAEWIWRDRQEYRLLGTGCLSLGIGTVFWENPRNGRAQLTPLLLKPVIFQDQQAPQKSEEGASSDVWTVENSVYSDGNIENMIAGACLNPALGQLSQTDPLICDQNIQKILTSDQKLSDKLAACEQFLKQVLEPNAQLIPSLTLICMRLEDVARGWLYQSPLIQGWQGQWVSQKKEAVSQHNYFLTKGILPHKPTFDSRISGHILSGSGLDRLESDRLCPLISPVEAVGQLALDCWRQAPTIAEDLSEGDPETAVIDEKTEQDSHQTTHHVQNDRESDNQGSVIWCQSLSAYQSDRGAEAGLSASLTLLQNAIATSVLDEQKSCIVTSSHAGYRLVQAVIDNLAHSLADVEDETMSVPVPERLSELADQPLQTFLNRPLPVDHSDFDVALWDKTRRSLARYQQLMGQAYGNTGRTPLDLFWSVERARQRVPSLVGQRYQQALPLPDLNSQDRMDPHERRETMRLFAQFVENYVASQGDLKTHAWRGYPIMGLPDGADRQIGIALEQIQRATRQAGDVFKELRQQTHLYIPHSWHMMEKLGEWGKSFPILPETTATDLYPRLVSSEAADLIRDFAEALNEYAEYEPQLSTVFGTDWVKIEPETAQSILREKQDVLGCIPADTLIINLTQKGADFTRGAVQIQDALRRYDDVCELLQVKIPAQAAGVTLVKAALELADQAPLHVWDYSETLYRPESWEALDRAQNMARPLLQQEAILSNWFHLETLPDPELLARSAWLLETTGTLSRFDKNWRAAKQLFADLSIAQEKYTVAPQEMARRLAELAQWIVDMRRFEEDADLQMCLGANFSGLSTNFAHLRDLVSWYVLRNRLLGNGDIIPDALHEMAKETQAVLRGFRKLAPDRIRALKALSQQQDSFLKPLAGLDDPVKSSGRWLRQSEILNRVCTDLSDLGVLSDISVSGAFEALEHLEKCLRLREKIDQNISLRDLLSNRYQGAETDWRPINQAIAYVRDIQALHDFPKGLSQWLFIPEARKNHDILQDLLLQMAGICAQIRQGEETLCQFYPDFNWADWMGRAPDQMLDIPVQDIGKRCALAQAGLLSLTDWVAVCELGSQLAEGGWQQFIQTVLKGHLNGDDIMPFYEYCLAHQSALAVFKRWPELENVVKQDITKLSHQYFELETKRLQMNFANLKEKLRGKSLSDFIEILPLASLAEKLRHGYLTPQTDPSSLPTSAPDRWIMIETDPIEVADEFMVRMTQKPVLWLPLQVTQMVDHSCAYRSLPGDKVALLRYPERIVTQIPLVMPPIAQKDLLYIADSAETGEAETSLEQDFWKKAIEWIRQHSKKQSGKKTSQKILLNLVLPNRTTMFRMARALPQLAGYSSLALFRQNHIQLWLGSDIAYGQEMNHQSHFKNVWQILLESPKGEAARLIGGRGIEDHLMALERSGEKSEEKSAVTNLQDDTQIPMMLKPVLSHVSDVDFESDNNMILDRYHSADMCLGRAGVAEQRLYLLGDSSLDEMREKMAGEKSLSVYDWEILRPFPWRQQGVPVYRLAMAAWLRDRRREEQHVHQTIMAIFGDS